MAMLEEDIWVDKELDPVGSVENYRHPPPTSSVEVIVHNDSF